MKVRCKIKCTEYSGTNPYWYSPDVDDVIEVVDVVMQLGKKWYDLLGYSEFLYDADCFEVVRDTPAEVIEEQETELVTA